ncbi:pirin family protein [Roseateles violae]|uniref:Pirin family protein n=1 Tax=Roseateles violae TaxID=3058042 RepID=A0ABT8DWR1_9BURK|nr:pirin family protein [Pelomonas sp. PFR6]MDN3922611.1 pirin family protein [Pelomonas sp. PFR6]
MPLVEKIPGHPGDVGGLPINRALPTARRRLVGAWCFLDHAGPADLAPDGGMRVAPHPHTGLQTFSWMIEGEILHRDSLGSEQVLRPGQVNLMTAGRGIAHSEESLSARLQLAQLWIALPDAQRFCAPAFEHFATLPRLAAGGFALTLLAGEHGGARSPVPQHTPLLGLDLASAGAAETVLALRPGFEHGLMVLEGSVELSPAGEPAQRLEPGSLLYLAPGFDALALRAEAACRLLLLGGEPLTEQPLLWWNFVGRSGEEIHQFAADWNAGSGAFAGVEVQGFDGPRLLAPDASQLRLRTTE